MRERALDKETCHISFSRALASYFVYAQGESSVLTFNRKLKDFPAFTACAVFLKI